MATIRRIAHEELDRLAPGSSVIDVREPGEFAGARLPGSVNVPLSSFEAGAARLPKDKPVVVLCQSGRRAGQAAERLKALGFAEVLVVEGGLSACGAGALEKGPGGAWAMERQVRMAAGSLTLLGAAIGWLVHPLGWGLCAFIGAGLVFSAATDTCTMARVLAKLPWNRGRG